MNWSYLVIMASSSEILKRRKWMPEYLQLLILYNIITNGTCLNMSGIQTSNI